MSNKYKVKVNASIEFDITDDDVSKLNAEKIAGNKYHVLQNNKPFKAELVDSNFNRKKYSIKVNNHSYDVDISNPLDLLIDKMGFTFGSSKQVDSIKAPMPGLILDIHVKEGQEVKEDEGLLILEAMKMENVITSPRDGVIKSVNITKGDAIDKGHLLIEFE
jgi:biotin carboxyl carrier protein